MSFFKNQPAGIYPPGLLLRLLPAALLFAGHASAIMDTNSNGISDVFERQWNHGELFAADFTAAGDADGDSMTNGVEAVFGTDPMKAAPFTTDVHYSPATYITGAGGEPEILSPAGLTITWPSVAGKSYTVLFSTDLAEGSWAPVGDPVIGDGNPAGKAITLTQPDGSVPPKFFLRLKVADIPSDSYPGLTQAEEYLLALHPEYAGGGTGALVEMPHPSMRMETALTRISRPWIRTPPSAGRKHRRPATYGCLRSRAATMWRWM